jgi:hypothetical protein
VLHITTPIRAQQGQGQGTPYYDIILVSRDGKKITLGKTIRDKREAEWLASEMKRLIGIGRPKAAAATAGW